LKKLTIEVDMVVLLKEKLLCDQMDKKQLLSKKEEDITITIIIEVGEK